MSAPFQSIAVGMTLFDSQDNPVGPREGEDNDIQTLFQALTLFKVNTAAPRPAPFQA